MLLFKIAGTLGVSTAVATSIVSIILTGSTLVTIILAITTILSGGVDAILTMGWSAFVATVKKIVAERGAAAAAAWYSSSVCAASRLVINDQHL